MSTTTTWSRLHSQAVRKGLDHYVDPATGLQVMTTLGHERRGSCCGCGCRHCPFPPEPAAPAGPGPQEYVPRLLNSEHKRHGNCDLLFWSGGKDSYLFYRYLQKELADQERDIVLLTTYSAQSQIVAHQEVPFRLIVDQSHVLQVPLLAVPLFPRSEYVDRIQAGLTELQPHYRVERLVFGDLHLEHIRSWREVSFYPRAHAAWKSLHFPVWGKPYADLMQELVHSGAKARVTAAPYGDCGGLARIGAYFGPEFLTDLPDGVDPFGETGEFHTSIEVLTTAS